MFSGDHHGGGGHGGNGGDISLNVTLTFEEAGKVRYAQETPFGRVVSMKPCNVCAGTGRIVKEPCTSCGGRGSVRKNSNLRITFPPGVEPNQIMTIPGEGERMTFKLKEQGLENPKKQMKGDLLVTIDIELPRNLSKEQRQKIKELHDSLKPEQYDKAREFIKK